MPRYRHRHSGVALLQRPFIGQLRDRAWLLVTVIAVGLSAFQVAHAAPYTFDGNRTEVQFKYTIGFSDGRGRFTGVTGTVDFDDAAPQRTKVDALIDTRTLTADSLAVGELRGPSFFDVARHPRMRFVSRSVRSEGADRLQMDGVLTIKGISRPVRLQVNMQRRAGAIEFAAAMRIRRSEFNMTGYSMLVGDIVSIEIRGPLRPAR